MWFGVASWPGKPWPAGRKQSDASPSPSVFLHRWISRPGADPVPSMATPLLVIAHRVLILLLFFIGILSLTEYLYIKVFIFVTLSVLVKNCSDNDVFSSLCWPVVSFVVAFNFLLCCLSETIFPVPVRSIYYAQLSFIHRISLYIICGLPTFKYALMHTSTHVSPFPPLFR